MQSKSWAKTTGNIGYGNIEESSLKPELRPSVTGKCGWSEIGCCSD
jgi:hypothetical protein